MTSRVVQSVLFVALSASLLRGQVVPEGIPRDFARQRAAQISDVRYELSFNLVPRATTTKGHEVLRFQLKSALTAPLLLDYRDGAASSVSVNGNATSTALENGHLVLPAAALHAGENVVAIDFTSNIAPAGKPITRFEDKDDGSEYIYTLFVPMDASMAFPCFDQPDIKGRFTLKLTTNGLWKAVSNTQITSYESMGGWQQFTFAETHPISTYVFAFAAGPFKKIERAGMPTLYVRQSKLERALPEAEEVQQTTQRGMDFLAQYFAQPFPFPKYDLVLIPGLAYGGMEHAGETFLREESVLFRTAPTRTDRMQRKILLLHELTHQWFGDLTTMRWFDDLWLKEGFAQYMAYHTLAELNPDEAWRVWNQFYQAIKPNAYAIDVTKGTTPIYQDIPNLKDAKSAYGAIVYSKAPGVLKQLAYVLGSDSNNNGSRPDAFRDGLRLYLKEHLYANAEWADLVHAFERASGQKLDGWAEMWIRHRGMPQVDVEWACDGGKVTSLRLKQHDVLGEGGVWPITALVALHYPENNKRFRVQFSSAETTVSEAAGAPCPEFVFANDLDYAYGRFLLDPQSQAVVLQKIGTTQHMRPLLWGSLWEAVRTATLAPRDYVRVTTQNLPNEDEEPLLGSLLTRSATALHRYMSKAAREQLAAPLEELAAERMNSAKEEGLRILWFRGLRGFAETDFGRMQLKQLLAGKVSVPGVQLRQLDRWNMVTTLVALGDSEANAVFSSEQQRDPSGDGRKYAYVAEAARPDAATKKKYFDDYLHNPARPEDWVDQSLGAFNHWSQAELTAPYLRPALDALPQIKRERKIFFLVAWLNAFIEGQTSAVAQRQVYDFLKSGAVEPDTRLKILQAVDELDRAVAIRQKYPE